MRHALIPALLGAFLAVPLRAAEATPDRLSRYFTAWYSVCPETKVTVSRVPELAIPGFESYRVERTCALKNRNEMSVTLYDAGGDEVFVGEVLHDDTRKGRPFSAAQDLPVLQNILGEAYGGSLKPIRGSVRLAEGASASIAGFVSEDGATFLLGRFRPLAVSPDALRRKLLSESPGIRPRAGKYYVTAFIDFQCEKCRQRTPQMEDFAFTHGGGALEIRFLPMMRVHDWAFAAAETASALAGVKPELYTQYERMVFSEASGMNEAAARQAGADVAEAARVGPAFREELSSGRARKRVARDVELAIQLGLNGTPNFFYDGAFLSSDTGIAENYIDGRLRPSGAPAPSGARGGH